MSEYLRRVASHSEVCGAFMKAISEDEEDTFINHVAVDDGLKTQFFIRGKPHLEDSVEIFYCPFCGVKL